MKLPKEIMNGFVSWIDLKDVQEYVKQLNEETIKKFIFGSFFTTHNIRKFNNFDFMITKYERSKNK